MALRGDYGFVVWELAGVGDCVEVEAVVRVVADVLLGDGEIVCFQEGGEEVADRFLVPGDGLDLANCTMKTQDRGIGDDIGELVLLAIRGTKDMLELVWEDPSRC